MIHNQIIVQGVGFVALCLTFALFQFNNRKTMLIVGTVGAALYAVHFILLGATTGAAMNAINIGRGLVFLKYHQKKRSTKIMYGFMLAFSIAGLLTWHSWISLLPILGMIAGTLAFWQLQPRRIRALALISPPCWFTYNFIVGSYPGMLAEVVNVASNLTALYRFDIKPQLTRGTKRLRRQFKGSAA